MVATAVDECRNRAPSDCDLLRAERLPPLVEELSEVERLAQRRLHVDDPVRRMDVEPIQAGSSRYEGAGGGLLDVHRADDPDAERQRGGLAVVINVEVDVDVVRQLFTCEA